MRNRHVLVAAAFGFVVLGIACVDLFHGTEFETLCSHSPNDPQCGGDAGTMGDVVADRAVDARRPHPDFCKWDKATARAQALRACAWLGACEGPLGESVFGPCVVRAQLAYDCAANLTLRPAGETDELWSCLSTVSTCGDVDQCVFPGGLQECAAVPSGSLTACSMLPGNRAVRFRCANPVAGRAIGIEPCAMLGQACSPEPGTPGSAASCSGSLGFTCTTTTCDGTSAVDCNLAGGVGTFDRGVNCASYAKSGCVLTEAGAPACIPGPGARVCAEDAPPKCLTNPTTGALTGVVASCVGGYEVAVNCTQLGLPCDDSVAIPSYDPAAACIRRVPPDVCTAQDGCVAGRLESCGRGLLQTIDCASVGLKECTITNGRAACKPP